MTTKRPIGFGYNPPTGNRQLERVEPATFVRDLGHVLDVASQAFDSFWVSDHHMPTFVTAMSPSSAPATTMAWS